MFSTQNFALDVFLAFLTAVAVLTVLCLIADFALNMLCKFSKKFNTFFARRVVSEAELTKERYCR